MSEYGDDGVYVVAERVESRLAKKEHACSACGESIRSGDRYTSAEP